MHVVYRKRNFVINGTDVLGSSSDPANGVKALKALSIKHWLAIIVSSFTTGLLMARTLSRHLYNWSFRILFDLALNSHCA